MKKKFNIDLTTQNKLIITALIISTSLIVAISFWAVNRVKIELDESYRSFGQLLTKTLAVQNYEVTQAGTNPTALSSVKAHVNSILASTNDITYITFKNKAGDVIYSTVDSFNKRARKTDTLMSSPIYDNNEKVVGLVDKMKAKPTELSGGEQQRVSIARAIVNGPPLLIADEPTGNLDPKNSMEIMQILEQINQKGITVLVSTHDHTMVDYFRKRVLTLEGGQIIRDVQAGTYE